ncbi:thioredoxin family protein [Emticicia sp. 17c]|uniref:thioredoxin family protein n=1 Tax=Emticicia sp. 17c TaxID=3127704 RepID=UPI00301BE07E
MKKITCCVIYLMVSGLIVEAQGIRFAEGTWAQIVAEAKAQQKLVFVDIYTTWCGPCKVMANNVFTNASVGEKFNASFINYKIDAEKGEGVALAKNYAVSSYPTYLFINGDGDLVYKTIGSMSIEKFISEADKAISAGKHYEPTSSLQKDFETGRRDAAFLNELLKRNKLTGTPNALILDEYLKAIPESAYKTEKVLMIIAEHISTIESKAFEILVSSLKRFMNMTPEQQKFVLEGISKAKLGTFKMAVEKHDKALLEKLIEAVRLTSYSENGFEAEEKQFRLDFARITHDADNFRIIASREGARLLEKTTEQLAVESAQKIERFKQNAQAKGIRQDTPQYAAALDEMQDNAEKLTAFHLNQYAWGYFQLMENKDDLETGLKWAERSVALFRSPINLHTYANLLARLGRKKEAVKAEKAAIKLTKKVGRATDELERTLKEIKKL